MIPLFGSQPDEEALIFRMSELLRELAVHRLYLLFDLPDLLTVLYKSIIHFTFQYR